MGFMNSFNSPLDGQRLRRVLAILLTLELCVCAEAAPTIVSTVPRDGANGVISSAAVVITFSEAMDTSLTVAYLIDSVTYAILPVTSAWNGGKTLLTCTPTPALPSNRTIYWTVNGQSVSGTSLAGVTGGTFTTASGDPLILTNANWTGGVFNFDVTSSVGQLLTVEFSSTLRSNSWQTLLTTNSPGGRVHLVDPAASTNRYRFYRARTGD